MVCPKCRGKVKVIRPASSENAVYRIRECVDCGLRFYTSEIIASNSRIAFYDAHNQYLREKRKRKVKQYD